MNGGNEKNEDTNNSNTVAEEQMACDNSKAANYVEAMIKALDLGDGEILLAIVWVTPAGKLNHFRYPYVLGCDITFGTNNERRPHFRATGKNIQNKSGDRKMYPLETCADPHLNNLRKCRSMQLHRSASMQGRFISNPLSLKAHTWTIWARERSN